MRGVSVSSCGVPPRASTLVTAKSSAGVRYQIQRVRHQTPTSDFRFRFPPWIPALDSRRLARQARHEPDFCQHLIEFGEERAGTVIARDPPHFFRAAHQQEGRCGDDRIETRNSRLLRRTLNRGANRPSAVPGYRGPISASNVRQYRQSGSATMISVTPDAATPDAATANSRCAMSAIPPAISARRDSQTEACFVSFMVPRLRGALATLRSPLWHRDTAPTRWALYGCSTSPYGMRHS